MSNNGYPFPGISTTTDGAGAIVWVDSQITQGGCAYPITSSTTMGSGYQASLAAGNKNPKSDEVIDFIHFARTEGRFSKQFDKDGHPSGILMTSNNDRLLNWRLLQELAGVI